MAATEKVSVEWEVKLGELTSALQTAGGLTEAEAKRMTISLDRQIQASKRAATDAAKAMKASKAGADDLRKGLASAGQLASSFGGTLGAMGATANAAGSALANLAGPVLGTMGVAAGVAVGAVAALAYGIVQGAQAADAYIDAAGPLIDRLGEISGTEPLPAATIAALDQYKQSSLGLEAATGRLHVVTAGFMAELAGPGLDALVGFANKVAEFAEVNGPVAIEIFGDMQVVARVFQAVLSGGGTEILRYATGLDGLAEAGHTAADGLIDSADAAKSVNDALSAGQRIIQIQTEAMLAMTGASDGMIAAQRATDANNESLQAYVDTLDMSVPAQQALADAAAQSVEVRNQQIISDATAADRALALTAATQAMTAATNAATAAERQRQATYAAAQKEEEEQKEGAEELANIRKDATSDMLTGEQKIQAAYDDRIMQAAAIADATNNMAAGEATIAALQERSARDVGQARWDAAQAGIAAEGEYAGKVQINLQAVTEAIGIASTIWSSGLAPAFDALNSILEQSASAANDVASGYRDAADAAQQAYEAASEDYLANAGDMSAADRAAEQSKIDGLAVVAEARAADAAAAEKIAADQAQKAFSAQKASAMAAAAVQAAVNFGALLPAFAFLGPFAPGAAFGVATLTYTAQVAAIQSAPPPTYHVGGMVGGLAPDEVPVLARKNEGFLTPLGVENVGGPEGVRAANNGTNRQMGDDSGALEVHLDRRMVGRAVAAVVRKPGGRRKRTGTAPTYRR